MPPTESNSPPASLRIACAAAISQSCAPAFAIPPRHARGQRVDARRPLERTVALVQQINHAARTTDPRIADFGRLRNFDHHAVQSRTQATPGIKGFSRHRCVNDTQNRAALIHNPDCNGPILVTLGE